MSDLNVHSRRWLKYSSGETAEAAALEGVCLEHGLWEKVRKPTRKDPHSGNEYLLDLVLTDLEGVNCTVEPKLADHGLVVATLLLPVPREELVQRRVETLPKTWVWAGCVLADI